MHATAVKMLKKLKKLKVLPSDAREAGEEDVVQVFATRGEKESDLGCCAGSAWTPVIDPVLTLAPVQRVT